MYTIPASWLLLALASARAWPNTAADASIALSIYI